MSEARTSSTKDEDSIRKNRFENVWRDIHENVYESNYDNELYEPFRSAPTMVFSVIGDSDSFAPRPWPKTVFQTALIEAAKSGGETWILFRGYQRGISKLIRDAYHYYGVMEFEEKNMETPINDVNRHIKLISIAGKKESPLGNNQYHTVNDGEGDGFLLGFETFVSEQTVHLFGRPVGLKMPVPIAVIVCEGDIQTIYHVLGLIINKIPVIIMKGSGNAADLILDFLENEDFLKKKAGILVGISDDDSEYEPLKNCLEFISKKRDMIRVFDLAHDDPLMLSSIIGEAVVGCWSKEGTFRKHGYEIKQKEVEKTKGNHVKQNSIPTGKHTPLPKKNKKSINAITPEPEKKHDLQENQYVFNPQFSTPTSLPVSFFFGYQILHEKKKWEERGHLLLLEALKGNRCDYVKVLLDQDVDIKKLNFAELYDQTVACQGCSFKDEDCLHMQWLLKIDQT